MRLADGGFRPAYNMQICRIRLSDKTSRLHPRRAPTKPREAYVFGFSEGGAMSMFVLRAYLIVAAGTRPADYLVDGGFTKNDDIEWAHASGIKLWCPPAQSKHGSDPYAPRGDDKPGVADWRRRMASEAGKALYKERSKAECPNAWARRMGLTRLMVRGKAKARAVLLWFALAHNMLRTFALRRAAIAAAT